MPLFLLLLSLMIGRLAPTPVLAETIYPSASARAAITDDLNYAGLVTALAESRRYYDGRPEQTYTVCGEQLSAAELSRAYGRLSHHLQTADTASLAAYLTANFRLCHPTSMLVTGYYSPVLAGSRQPSATYRFPIYAPPSEAELRRRSRAEIDASTDMQEYTLAYLADPLDLFFLHVQGSGIIELPDNSRLLVSYAADNGRPYSSIGALLIRTGKLSRPEVSLSTIRAYLTNHPEEQRAILQHNERYIFFGLSEPDADGIQARGSLGLPLTEGRSAAMDDAHYPPGLLGILSSTLPHPTAAHRVQRRPLNRLVVHQDSGAAIKGKDRLDLYLGQGDEAGRYAGEMKERGTFTILIPNLSFRADHSKIQHRQQ
ncbi:MAG: transglycosylase [Desulfobulbaceae bacterium]|nr:MAG: transglycosylase [Desulfobulbaceae bacterium]